MVLGDDPAAVSARPPRNQALARARRSRDEATTVTAYIAGVIAVETADKTDGASLSHHIEHVEDDPLEHEEGDGAIDDDQNTRPAMSERAEVARHHDEGHERAGQQNRPGICVRDTEDGANAGRAAKQDRHSDNPRPG
jgi:hypothetical protein